MLVVNEKRCSECRIIKSLASFCKNRINKDGLNYQCRVCCAKRNAAYRRSPTAMEFSKNRQKKYRESSRGQIIIKEHVCSPTGRETNRKNTKKFRSTLRGCLYDRYHHMKARCESPNSTTYRWYKNVVVAFINFDDFFQHVTIDLGYNTVAKLKGLQIHRIDNLNYQRGNIEFLTPKKHGACHRELRRKTV